MPILDWWISGYPLGQLPRIHLCTANANYALLEPAPEYHGLSKSLDDNVTLTKMIIEMIEEDPKSQLSDKDLTFLMHGKLTKEAVECLPNFTFQMLQANCEFITKQVRSLRKSHSINQSKNIIYYFF